MLMCKVNYLHVITTNKIVLSDNTNASKKDNDHINKNVSIEEVIDKSSLIADKHRETFKKNVDQNGIVTLTQWMTLSQDEKKIYPQILVKTLDAAVGKSNAL
jgi:hypothetical protein